MLRVLGSVGVIATLFFLPYALSILVLFVAACFVPLAGLALGIMLDTLYYTPGAAHLPYASLIGLIATLIGIVVQRFIRNYLSAR